MTDHQISVHLGMGLIPVDSNTSGKRILFYSAHETAHALYDVLLYWFSSLSIDDPSIYLLLLILGVGLLLTLLACLVIWPIWKIECGSQHPIGHNNGDSEERALVQKGDEEDGPLPWGRRPMTDLGHVQSLLFGYWASRRAIAHMEMCHY